MSIFIQYQDLHIPIIPEVMIEFDTVDADDEGSLLSRSTSLESKNNVVISTTTGSITTAAKEAIQKKGKVIRDSEELSLVDKEEFAYPTNLTSSEIDVSHLNDGGVEQGGLWSDRSIKKIESTLDSEKDSSHHNDDELLTVQRNGHSRANNPSSGSDLIQVTVEDLLISEEQNRTIRANTLRQLNGQKKNEINKVHPEHSEHLGEVDHAYEHKSVVKMSPSPTMTTTANSSNSSNSTSSVTMTTITATIRTTSDKARSILFDEDIALEVHSDSEEEKRQQRTQGEENVEEIKNKKPQQPQKGAGSQMRGKDSSKNAFQPLAPKALTPAQQREVEADENIQKAIELHENNQLEEATRYFALAAQSENPLGQLMYGLSLRHGWGCKSNPAEAIKYLQRAAEYAMGELNELNPITPSPQISTGIPIASTSTTPQELSVDEKRQSSSALSDRYSENDSNDSAKPRASQQTLRRMGSMDRKEAIAMARRELVMALYELGMSYLKGWGVNKDKKVAFTYFKIAADLGDADSQNETALCYYEGIGIEKDMYESARYYRMAAAQGASQLGNSWIWKPKYDQYCAAENAGRAIEGTLHSITNTVGGIGGSKKPQDKTKRLTTAIQTALLGSSSSNVNANPSTKSGITSSSLSASSSTSSISASVLVSPSSPLAQYSISSIASGLASVTAATTGVVAPSSCNSSIRQSLTSPSATTTPTPSISDIRTVPLPPPPQTAFIKTTTRGRSLSVVSASASSPTTPTSPLSFTSSTTAASPTISEAAVHTITAMTTDSAAPKNITSSEQLSDKKKSRWSLWGGLRSTPLSSSAVTTS